MTTRISQRISQGASALDSRLFQTRIDRQGGPVRTATTISFTQPATITDSGNGLGNFEVGAAIRIFGSTINDGEYIAKTRRRWLDHRRDRQRHRGQDAERWPVHHDHAGG